MRPLAVVNGILFGTFLAITVSLGAVILVFLLLGDEYPRLASEFSGLLAASLIFLVLTAFSSASFYTELKETRGRWWPQLAMWLGIVGATFYFLP